MTARDRQWSDEATRALNKACYAGLSDLAWACLCAGADAAEVGESGKCSLHYAAMAGHADLCRALAFSTPQALLLRDQGGMTPLHLACRNNRLEAALALLDAGCSPRERDDFGRTPFECCESNATLQALVLAQGDRAAMAAAAAGLDLALAAAQASAL